MNAISFAFSVLNLVFAAFNTHLMLGKYPEKIDAVSAGFAVLCFGVALITAPKR